MTLFLPPGYKTKSRPHAAIPLKELLEELYAREMVGVLSNQVALPHMDQLLDLSMKPKLLQQHIAHMAQQMGLAIAQQSDFINIEHREPEEGSDVPELLAIRVLLLKHAPREERAGEPSAGNS